MWARQVYGIGRRKMVGDFYEEDSDEPGKEREGDKTKAEEQPAMEPIAVDSKDVTKEGIAAIIIDGV